MKRFVGKRAWRVVWFFAIGLLSGFAWTPAPASSAWTVGDPIVTYWAGPGYVDPEPPLTDTTAALMADVGMNVVWAGSVAEINIAGQHGLRAMYQNTSVIRPDNVGTTALSTLVDSIKDNPALYEYHIVDEPSATTFSGLGSLVSSLRERGRNHAAYIDLFLNYASSSQLGVSNYSTYLNKCTLYPTIPPSSPSLRYLPKSGTP